MAKQDRIQTQIESLGQASIPSPLPFGRFVPRDKSLKIRVPKEFLEEKSQDSYFVDFEEAGPREHVYFDAPKTKCALVTCGGLCPGLNDVIRAIIMAAHHNYGVAATIGIRYGLQGFIPEYGHNILELTPQNVSHIHEFGGTMLASSRGPQPPEGIVDALERMNINILFMIGGDGTMRAASAIYQEISRRNLKISIIGIPKTIDNDIHFITQSFGFDTAVEKATEAIRCAHTEAEGALNGIGLVKLMGRESGFIAAQATMALKEVNFVLVPENRFSLYGQTGFLAALEKRLRERHHAVIVVAEGAGQELCRASQQKDASGNAILGDITTLLRQEIAAYFKKKNMPFALKYIDPSYIIRSVPANANDRIYCGFLGQHAVHAAMAGKTNTVIGKLQDKYLYMPLELVTKKRRKLDTNSNYWSSVLESTGQPESLFDPNAEL